MTTKRFQWVYIKNNSLELRDNGIVKVFNNERLEELLNELNDENEQLKAYVGEMEDYLGRLEEKNEQLKQDNNALIHLLENQSMIIQELHSKLLEYQIQEPIVLTKEDLELMGKAISYYTHGRCGE